jgi:hypothetical protein
MASVFPSIHVIDIPGTLNTMIYATRQPTDAADLAINLSKFHSRSDIHPLLLSTLEVTFASLQPGYEPTQIFTDDRAPIERIVDDMVIRFALGGDLEGLQP